MAGLPITFACGLYDRMLALYTGDVKPEGIDLKFEAIDHPRTIFDRMNDLEFDAAEMSGSDFFRHLIHGVVRWSRFRCSPRACSGTATSPSTVALFASRRISLASGSACRSTT